MSVVRCISHSRHDRVSCGVYQVRVDVVAHAVSYVKAAWRNGIASDYDYVIRSHATRQALALGLRREPTARHPRPHAQRGPQSLPARRRERAPPRAAHERGRLGLAAMVRREHELHQGRGGHRRGELRDDEGRRERRGVVDEPGGHACGTSLSLRIGRRLTSGVCRCCSRRRCSMRRIGRC